MARDAKHADTPKISVVTPHLNGATGLLRCLESLAAQTGDGIPFEAIVVDNGSRELPIAVVDRFSFARLEVEETPGPGPARSRGAHLAQGEILAFIDADCIARPGWLTAIATHFDTHPESQVIGGAVFILPRRAGYFDGIEAYEAVWSYRMKLYVERDRYTATCNMAVRSKIFAHVGDFSGIGLAEDVDWGQRASAMGVRIEYTPEVIIETPARESFAELQRKWDRHIGHDFAKLTSLSDRLRWILRILALIASPLVELPKLILTDRLTGAGARARALLCLLKIRLYRARRMSGMLISGERTSPAERWRNDA